MSFVALLEYDIALLKNNELTYYTPVPKCIQLASCMYNNQLYILCKNNDDYILRKVHYQEPFSTQDIILLPSDEVPRDIWITHEQTIFITTRKALIQVIFDKNHQCVIQMKKYELFSESNIDIDSFTYQDGYYYILANEPSDKDIGKEYKNYIFIFNEDFQYKQVYSIPLLPKCRHIRYCGPHILFICDYELFKYNLITNDVEHFITFQSNTSVHSYLINEQLELIFLLSNPNTELACDICKVDYDKPDQFNFLYLTKFSNFMKQIRKIEYEQNILLPVCKWKSSYIQHIIPDTTIVSLIEKLSTVYHQLDTLSHLFQTYPFDKKQITYTSLDDFIHISNNVLADVKEFLPSYEGNEPKQLLMDSLKSIPEEIKKVYDYCNEYQIAHSGWFLYPTGHSMGWHTNLDKEIHLEKNKRQYIVMNKNPFGSSFFLYRHPVSKHIHIVPDDVCTVIQFCFGNIESPLWHAVYAKEGHRMSFGRII